MRNAAADGANEYHVEESKKASYINECHGIGDPDRLEASCQLTLLTITKTELQRVLQ